MSKNVPFLTPKELLVNYMVTTYVQASLGSITKNKVCHYIDQNAYRDTKPSTYLWFLIQSNIIVYLAFSLSELLASKYIQP